MEHKERAKIEDVRPLVHRCTMCFRELVDEYYAHCIKCKDVNLCLPCLAEGIEKGKHIREHPFVIVDPKLKSIFRTDWTVEEEVLFIDAIQQFGLGNYRDIHTLLPFKSAAEFETHYQSVYFGSPFEPKPENEVLGKDDVPQPPLFETDPVQSYPSDGHDEILKMKNKKEATTPGEQAGFMPYRREFEYAYLEAADDIVCDMSFDPAKETEESFTAKLQRLTAYQNVLEMREQFTNVAIELELTEKPFTPPAAQTNEQNEANAKLLPFIPYIGKEKTLEAIQLAQEAKKKKVLIEMRQKWQRNGVQSISEGFLFKKLESLAPKDRLSSSDIENWNRCINEFMRQHSGMDTPEAQLLDPHEAELCHTEKIPTQLYFVLKDLLVRECELRDGLARDEARDFSVQYSREVLCVYDYLMNVGIIYE